MTTNRSRSSEACPFCGATSGISTRSEDRRYTAPFGPTVTYSAVENECTTCGSAGDFAEQNEKAVNDAIEVSVRASVQRMLELLAAKNLTMAHIERAVDLPARTLARWKAGEVARPGVVLLRMLATFPWLLSVAEEQYDPAHANSCVVAAAAEVLQHAQCLWNAPSSIATPSAGRPSSFTLEAKNGGGIPALLLPIASAPATQEFRQTWRWNTELKCR